MTGISYVFRSCVRHIYSAYLGLREMCVRRNVRIGKRVFLSGKVRMLGNNLVNDDCRLIDCELGAYSYVSPQSVIVSARIGNYCSIGPGVKIGLGLHPFDRISTSPFFYNEKIFGKKRAEDFNEVELGHDVWVGANALIMGGVKVGVGAVVGAGAVVTKDVPAFAIVLGVPARVVKYRFDEITMNRVFSSQWWFDSPEKVRAIDFDIFG